MIKVDKQMLVARSPSTEWCNGNVARS